MAHHSIHGSEALLPAAKRGTGIVKSEAKHRGPRIVIAIGAGAFGLLAAGAAAACQAPLWWVLVVGGLAATGLYIMGTRS